MKTEIMNESSLKPKPTWIESLKPSECRDWEEPSDYKLVGDRHLVRGGITVIAGSPGVGKSRAAVQLAISAAKGDDWLDIPVHGKFRTYILQDENGRHRMKDDFENSGEELDARIRITATLERGMCFNKPEFRAAFTRELKAFGPHILIVDPLMNAARDCSQADYSDMFDHIRECVPKGEKSPAIIIVAHTRKMHAEHRPSGTALLNELIGSTKLGSVPRSVFVMQHASNDTEDGRIVFTCCKNNDGEKGQRTAWQRHKNTFSSIDFDWDEFDYPETGRICIKEEDMVALFEGGQKAMPRKEALDELMRQTDAKKSAAYGALALDGRFGAHLSESEGLLHWK